MMIWRSYIFLLICLLLSAPGKAQKVQKIKVNASNARAYRDSLNLAIFGTTAFPYTIMPDAVFPNVGVLDLYTGFPYLQLMNPLGNLQSIDKYVVTLDNNLVDFPAKPVVYVFRPHTSNGKLFIYHSGHCVGIAPAEDIISNANGTEPGLVIPKLLADGYTVLAVPMLHYKANPVSGVMCGFNNHDDLFTDGHYANPLSLFFKPLIASLNYLGRGNFSAIYMTGLSGGGWTTSVYPAMDSSITYSFPVAGSWPMPLREMYYPGGDYEQTYPPLYSSLLDYHEIYALACLAPARKMLQINNRYDECCFSGSEAHVYYVDSVTNALQGSGGVFKFYLDETGTRHVITERAMQVIGTFIANEEGSLLLVPADSATNGTNYSYDIRSNFRVNTAPDQSVVKCSLLKAPGWLTLNAVSGMLSGVVPADNIFSTTDTISFKSEDSTGRFVIYNYTLTRKRNAPVLFTKFDDDSTVWFLPPYSHSLESLPAAAAGFFFFSNPLRTINAITIENNSLIRIKTNLPFTDTDKIGYNGFNDTDGLVYNNGLKLEDFALTPIKISAVAKHFAVPGMMRFNTETMKFEYFNGFAWINMN